MQTLVRENKRVKRHKSLRKRVTGTPERPRLSIHKSHLNLSAQVIDDLAGKTLISSSTIKLAKKSTKQHGNIEGSKEFGKLFAAELKKKGLVRVVFDRGGWPYHGRIKAFAEALRENGIEC